MTNEDLKALQDFAAGQLKDDGVTVTVTRDISPEWYLVIAVKTSGGRTISVERAERYSGLQQAKAFVDHVIEVARGS